MANKLISDLTLLAAPAIADYVEVQVVGQTITKRTTITGILLPEITARQAQDDVIESSCGLDADGQISTQWDNSWYMRAAEFTAGITDRGGATGAITENIINATRLLDGQLHDLANQVNGIAGEISSIHVELSNAQCLTLFHGGTGWECIPNPGADFVIELLDASAFINYSGGALVAAGTDTLDLFYTGFAATVICSWPHTFIESAADLVQKGTYIDNYVMKPNTALRVRATTANDTGGVFTGTIHLYLTYRVHSTADTASGVIPET